MKKCHTCEKELMEAYFNAQSGEDCIFCANDRITIESTKKHAYEEVEDKGCAGGACTL
ncbi:hypothetical protein PE074_01640 [Wohlfahrtiimonas chitiniclastica]|uniref:Uncharacterized protein n=1 Tax=Wohlfahrtiimonas chitiniclastica SH04 TaxID=1261130 RepID=L8Y1H0_9GAMM|nr:MULTISPECIES: hypothetical protein [Wohlfahrtiimonas]ELV08341.1 Hypothetical protein F387_00587 [Wohlfahrtiimonas chitiniclastica SH04]KZS23270.1 hypothetical protein BMY_1117 [Wohlfahrtiimonas chitiniclastica]MBS7814207.1 hypothetical protein [Wohlfahrtiimonas chitiniclastica]MBS7818186.1 hypothetical protein [Wohlfahrtiimonas chitiniclastica]MBS7826064.1 hypothetical protein [Wohlfahrtiimonas chitiniclastica]